MALADGFSLDTSLLVHDRVPILGTLTLRMRWHRIDSYDVFAWEIVEEVDDPLLLPEREQYWIAHYESRRNEYNCTDGGEGCHGRVLSDETKKKIDDAHRGKALPPFSAEHRNKIGDAHRNKTVSQATRDKLIKANRGRPEWHCRRRNLRSVD